MTAFALVRRCSGLLCQGTRRWLPRSRLVHQQIGAKLWPSAMAFNQRDESRLALAANLRAYRSPDERTYIGGAPHLKHRGVAAIYESMVADAVSSLPKRMHPTRLLDLGTGSGLALEPWLKRGIHITAVDSSQTMLSMMMDRAREVGIEPTTSVSDVMAYVSSCSQRFDVVTFISLLHHIPDYLSLLTQSARLISPGGALITFQDPLRYDRVPRSHLVAAKVSYLWWRTREGNLRRGFRTQLRRLRGVYSATEPSDYEEYHVVRNGVDSELIAGRLHSLFAEVRIFTYWSTQSNLFQGLGERLRLRASFGVLATGRLSA